MEKKFRLSADRIKELIPPMGGCFATDRITVDGKRVGYMYREEPDNDADSGWRLLAGDETEQYMDGAANHGYYDVNTLCNYDTDIIPFLKSPVGSAFARDPMTGKLDPVEFQASEE